jgi:hypothetical protein
MRAKVGKRRTPGNAAGARHLGRHLQEVPNRGRPRQQEVAQTPRRSREWELGPTLADKEAVLPMSPEDLSDANP